MTLKVVRGVGGSSASEIKPTTNNPGGNQAASESVRAATVIATHAPSALGGEAAVSQVRTIQKTQNADKKLRNLLEAEDLAKEVADEVRSNKELAGNAHGHLSPSSGAGTLV